MFRHSQGTPTIGVPISADHRGLRSETAAHRASALTIARRLFNSQIVSRQILAVLELDGADRVAAEPLGTKDSIPHEGRTATITSLTDQVLLSRCPPSKLGAAVVPQHQHNR